MIEISIHDSKYNCTKDSITLWTYVSTYDSNENAC